MTSYITCYNPGMETKEHVAEITRQGLARLQQETQETNEFWEWWSEARKAVEAAAGAATSGVHEVRSEMKLQAERENGGSKINFFWHFHERPAAYLRFNPDPEARRVVCTCSPSELDVGDTYERDSFTEDAIGRKIGEFLTAIFERRAREIRTGGGPGKLGKYVNRPVVF